MMYISICVMFSLKKLGVFQYNLQYLSFENRGYSLFLSFNIR